MTTNGAQRERLVKIYPFWVHETLVTRLDATRDALGRSVTVTITRSSLLRSVLQIGLDSYDGRVEAVDGHRDNKLVKIPAFWVPEDLLVRIETAREPLRRRSPKAQAQAQAQQMMTRSSLLRRLICIGLDAYDDRIERAAATG